MIRSIHLNFFTKISPFSIFGHDFWLKQDCISLFYPYLKMLNITKKKLLRNQYFDHVHIYPFSYQPILIFFEHPVWLKKPFISLVYPVLKKASKMLKIKEATLFRRPYILIKHSENAPQDLPFIFWTKCMAKIRLLLAWFIHSCKKAAKMHQKEKSFQIPSILIISIYLHFCKPK